MNAHHQVSPSELPQKPLLKPWYRVLGQGERTILQHLESVVVLKGRAADRLLPVLLPLLDGTRSVDEIVAALGEPARPAIEHALVLLADRGLLTSGRAPRTSLDESAAFVAAGDPLGSLVETTNALARAVVAVVGSGSAASEVSRLLRRSGVACPDPVDWHDDTAAVDLVVVAPAPAELPLLLNWNERAQSDERSWYQIIPFDGRVAIAGPLYVPGETACYECFRRRRASISQRRDELLELDLAPAPALGPASLDAALAGIAVTVVLRWLAARDAWAPGTMLALEPVGEFRLTSHVVHRLPRCPVCSAGRRRSAALPWRTGVA